MAEGEWTLQEAVPGCPFCEMARGELATDLVYADHLAIAFLDHRPLFPGHVLVAPRVHVPTLAELPDGMIGPFFTVVRGMSVAVRLAMDGDGSFVAINNHVSQSVPHLHAHVVPRRFHDGLRGFFWPRHTYASGEEREAVRSAVAKAAETVLGRGIRREEA